MSVRVAHFRCRYEGLCPPPSPPPNDRPAPHPLPPRASRPRLHRNAPRPAVALPRAGPARSPSPSHTPPPPPPQVQCKAPPTNLTTTTCTGDALEVLLRPGIGTRNRIGLWRVATPTIQSVFPPRGFYNMSQDVTIIGYGSARPPAGPTRPLLSGGGGWG